MSSRDVQRPEHHSLLEPEQHQRRHLLPDVDCRPRIGVHDPELVQQLLHQLERHRRLRRRRRLESRQHPTVTYSGSLNASGGTKLLSLYGWSTNPLVEYYVIEGYVGLAQLLRAEHGHVTSDGGTYTIIKHQQVNQPSIRATLTFWQYLAIRTVAAHQRNHHIPQLRQRLGQPRHEPRHDELPDHGHRGLGRRQRQLQRLGQPRKRRWRRRWGGGGGGSGCTATLSAGDRGATGTTSTSRSPAPTPGP